MNVIVSNNNDIEFILVKVNWEEPCQQNIFVAQVQYLFLIVSVSFFMVKPIAFVFN